MKIKITLVLVLVTVLGKFAHAQVWYPEGVFFHSAPVIIKVDNQVMTVSKISVDAVNSSWQVCVFNGKSWEKLPVLILNRNAEITDMLRYQGMIYISGNFTHQGTSTSLVRFNLTGKWEGLAKFMKSSVPAAITTMDVQDNQLILGGSFFNLVVGSVSDTISHLARYNGMTNKFSHYFEGCKRCDPDNHVADIVSNDSFAGISGSFTRIGGKTSKFFVRIYKRSFIDTFVNTPRMMEKLAIDGHILYATATNPNKNKELYAIEKAFTVINYNLDSALHIHEILVHDGHLVANGIFNMASNASRISIIKLDGLKWIDISNNYRNAHYIASGRAALFAVGNAEQPVSVWNPNRVVVRFFPGMSLLKVKVFLDSNNNCVKEKHERPVPKQYVRMAGRGAFSNEHGMTEFLVPNAVQNTQKFVIYPLRNHTRSNCADTIVSKTLIPGVYTDSIQFPMVRIPNVNDIRLFLSSPKGAQVVKNKTVTYLVTAENVGSNPISGKIRLTKNPKFTDMKTDPVATGIDKSTYEWNYPLLQPGERRVYMYTGLADDTTFDTDQQFTAMASSSITSGSSQYTEDDNDSIPQVVSGTVNPFRKDVYPTPDPGDSITWLDPDARDLRYHISFNNFTSDTVFYAVVIDTLDLNLDMSYIQETGSNKPYYTEVQSDPNNQYKGVLIWHFPDIRLTPNPTKNFEILSSGSYIGFKVVTKPLSNGYLVKNVASVFYDNEYAGMTNPVYCSVNISGIDDLYNGQDKLKVYPNPFDEGFVLVYDLEQGDAVSMYDMNGKSVYHQKVTETSSEIRVDPGQLTPGLYSVQILSGGNLIQRKLIKL
mgnify:CR=1 FL=1